jgi:hypothetical protein
VAIALIAEVTMVVIVGIVVAITIPAVAPLIVT